MQVFFVVVSVLCVFFILSHIYFKKFLLMNYSISSGFIVPLASTTVAFSAFMLFLVILEILDSFDPDTRLFLWRMDLWVLCALLVVVTPSALCFHLCFGMIANKVLATLVGIALQGVGYFLFWKLGDEFPVIDNPEQSLLSIEQGISRIGVIGITTAALLSGLGAIGCFNYITCFPWCRRTVTADDIETQKGTVKKFMRIIATKKTALVAKSRQLDVEREQASKDIARMPFLSRVSMVLGLKEVPPVVSALEKEVEDLTVQIQHYNVAARSTFLDLLEAIEDHQQQERFKGWARWLFWNSVGFIMLIVSVLKIRSALINSLFTLNPNQKDKITRGFEIALKFVNLPHPENWVQSAAFLFTSTLIIQGLYSTLARFARFFSNYSTYSSLFSMVLLVAQVVGMYIVSWVLVIRMDLPPAYRESVTQALGDMNFTVFHRWSDVIFLLSFLMSLVSLLIARVRRHEPPTLPGEGASPLAKKSV